MKETQPMSGKSKTAGPTPSAAALPEKERRGLGWGIAILLAFAAALSAPSLYGLGRFIDYPKQIAWLLPASLDGYAATSIWFGRRVVSSHPAAKSARRNARLSLAMTVACNGLFHLLVLAGGAIPEWLRVTLLVIVSSLPPIIVDRLLHLRNLANGETVTVAAATDTDAKKPPKATKKTATDDDAQTTTDDAKRRQATAETDDRIDDDARKATAESTTATTPSTKQPDDDSDDQAPVATVTNLADRRRGDADWARIAAPHYRAYMRANGGKGPSGPKLALILKDAGHELLSNSRAREIRRATEEHLKNNPADETERARQVAS
jgi:hypothetical protein